jgi:hypothetical protein
MSDEYGRRARQRDYFDHVPPAAVKTRPKDGPGSDPNMTTRPDYSDELSLLDGDSQSEDSVDIKRKRKPMVSLFRVQSRIWNSTNLYRQIEGGQVDEQCSGLQPKVTRAREKHPWQKWDLVNR